MPRFALRKKRLEEAYGFPLPDCLYQFWDFAKALSPLDPLKCLEEPLGIFLVGPFEILHGCLDHYHGPIPLNLHWRYSLDPPEFMTLMASGNNGWHAGLYFDLPDSRHFSFASYHAAEGLEFSLDGHDPFSALLAYCQERNEFQALGEGLEFPQDSSTAIEKTQKVLGRYQKRELNRAPRRVGLKTLDGMGVVAPAKSCAPFTKKTQKAFTQPWTDSFFHLALEEAGRHLQAGAPGSALKLAKDVWAAGEEASMRQAAEIMMGAYEALGREPFKQILEGHMANLNRPWLDILDAG